MSTKDGERGAAATERVTLERIYPATLAEVWALWTTREGIEAWWGPDGFAVEVRSLDLRPGGELRYLMIAKQPEMVAFMKAQGMPTAQDCRLRYTVVEPMRRLAWLHATDFIPGIEPYDVAHDVALSEGPRGVKVVLTIDRMHDETWTQRAVQGWAMELGKLARVLAGRAG
jgi:uncharacterized protein YndB with AHSA1/START domain